MGVIPAVAPARDHVRGAVDGLRFVFRHMPHDRLSQHQHELGDADLREHAARVEEDFRGGAASGMPSTPRFFVNGLMHMGSPTEPDLRSAIEARY